MEGEEDFGSLFENAEDVSEAVVTEEPKDTTNYDFSVASLKFPFQLSGKFTTEGGAAYIIKGNEGDFSPYFDFKNYIYFITRPDKYLALKGTIKTSLPEDDDDTEDLELSRQSTFFYVYEMYFDYLAFDRFYLTAGKKKSVWGNIRLFSSAADLGGDDDALFTNIMYDSRLHISGILKVPVMNHTFTAVAMYRDGLKNNKPGSKDMSFAGSAEFVFFNTSLNLFGRRFPRSDSDIAINWEEYELKRNPHQSSIIGAELKRSLLGFDIYGQTLARIPEEKENLVKNVFTSKFKDLTPFEKIVTTGGIYRIWNESTPYIFFNVEYQNIYRPIPDYKNEPKEVEFKDADGQVLYTDYVTPERHFFTHRIAAYAGIGKLGPGKKLAVGCQWYHDFTAKTGFLKPGIQISRALPHCDWRIGMEYEYGLNDPVNLDKYKTDNGVVYTKKITIGTYVTISMDY